MSVLGLGSQPKTDDKKAISKQDKPVTDKETGNSQNDEAKALLAKMEAKKDAGDCPFC
jgi:hypothetical protein